MRIELRSQLHKYAQFWIPLKETSTNYQPVKPASANVAIPL
jgi:hypothetical protein